MLQVLSPILAKCPTNGMNIQQDAAISDFGDNKIKGKKEGKKWDVSGHRRRCSRWMEVASL